MVRAFIHKVPLSSIALYSKSMQIMAGISITFEKVPDGPGPRPCQPVQTYIHNSQPLKGMVGQAGDVQT